MSTKKSALALGASAQAQPEKRKPAAPAESKPNRKDVVAAIEAPKIKQKLVRDSFTIPKSEYAVLDALKQRSTQLKRPAKKGELLRAGIVALKGFSDAAFLAVLNEVPSLKTGRPKNVDPVQAPVPGKPIAAKPIATAPAKKERVPAGKASTKGKAPTNEPVQPPAKVSLKAAAKVPAKVAPTPPAKAMTKVSTKFAVNAPTRSASKSA